MGGGEILIASIVGIILWSVIIYSIIPSASRSKMIETRLHRQAILLAKMARQAGVCAEEVNKIINEVLP